MPEFETTITKHMIYKALKAEDDVCVFECTLPSSVLMPYISGQFAMVAVDEIKLLQNPNALKWASYSISSSPSQKGMLEFCVGGGSPTGVTNHIMTKCISGSKIKVRGAFGNFKLNDAFDELLLIATGTGIAPIISMARTLLATGNKKPITMVYGFRYSGIYLYQKEIEALQKKHPNFKALPIMSSMDDKAWKGERGHVQDVLGKHSFSNPEKINVYICGRPSIVDEIVAKLKSLSFDAAKIHFEKW